MTKDEKTNLWHYTTVEGLGGILKNQTFWASDYRYLNDASEIIHSKEIIISQLLPRIMEVVKNMYSDNSQAKAVIDSHGGPEKTAQEEARDTAELLYDSLLNSPDLGHIPHVLSFCEATEDDEFVQRNGLLSQWRSYGKDGGYAIVLHKENLIELFRKEEDKFYYGIIGDGAIEYENEISKISDELIKHLKNIGEFAFEHYKKTISRKSLPAPMESNLSALTECMLRFKHRGFREEKEYRFYGFPYPEKAKSIPGFIPGKSFKDQLIRNREGTLVPYINFFEVNNNLPIKKICIGPNRDKKLRGESVKALLTALNLENIKVECSEIPFIG